MISTKFLPMSCTSPLTVASTIFPLSESDGFEVENQALLRAFDDVPGKPFQRSSRPRGLLSRLRALRLEVGGEGRDRIVASVEEEVLAESPFLLRDRRIAHLLLGIHDREIEARLHAVVEEDGVQYFAAALRKAEADVRDAEDRLALRKSRLDRADPFDRLGRAAHVLFVPRTARKHERIEDQVLGGNPVLLGQERVASPRDLDLPLAGHAHAVDRVFVDRS